MIVTHAQNQQTQHIQRYLPIGDTIETQLAVLYREVSLIQRLICPHTLPHMGLCTPPKYSHAHVPVLKQRLCQLNAILVTDDGDDALGTARLWLLQPDLAA